ncbi:hypothetical protein [Legionella fallonii]|uniref:5-carboxymethyl-2-hydroxymuconate Delta-isomerase n=1 Tax=Legionella fallonii LLAP-10 TaxID=1212491 RepID=A0A098G0X2_9GAMM|nr:hypothetical protein [Legionella fallonii]CEG56123.1 conserved protein of unknown function [Legionella fallonii LLAP-10]
MPQISLRISKNIDIVQLDFNELFAAIHDVLREAPNVDVSTCQSGVIHEDFSYIGLGEDKRTKVYLELYWVETEQRVAIKKQLALQLMKILEDYIVPEVEQQKLICIPRVRIANFGVLDQDYYISQRTPAVS